MVPPSTPEESLRISDTETDSEAEAEAHARTQDTTAHAAGGANEPRVATIDRPAAATTSKQGFGWAMMARPRPLSPSLSASAIDTATPALGVEEDVAVAIPPEDVLAAAARVRRGLLPVALLAAWKAGKGSGSGERSDRGSSGSGISNGGGEGDGYGKGDKGGGNGGGNGDGTGGGEDGSCSRGGGGGGDGGGVGYRGPSQSNPASAATADWLPAPRAARNSLLARSAAWQTRWAPRGPRLRKPPAGEVRWTRNSRMLFTDFPPNSSSP